jgi:glycosyltransferase involved in cell wall biosynthesis
MKKILLINENIGYGGATKILSFVANTLAERGHEVTFLTYREKVCFQKLDKTVKLIHIPFESIDRRAVLIPYTVFKLHKFIKSNYFDVAIAFLSPSQLRLITACWLTKTKVLVSQRGDPYQKPKGIKNNLISKINRFIFSQADFFVFQTKMAQEFYSKKVQLRSCVIPNPIRPLARTMPRTQKTVEKKIVCVARLDLNQKRHDLLIKAFKMLSCEYPDYTLELYGTGEDESIIRDLIGQSNNINLCGMTKNVVAAIQNAAMFVLTSDYEGIPNALLEAMSLGVPCISTDCSPGGAAMLIENGINGLLVNQGDVVGLYNAMKYYVKNPHIAETMGAKGTEVCDRFSEEIISELWRETVGSL